MAELIPRNFPQPTGNINVNYDFVDVLETTGYIQLYGVTDTAGNYFLSRQQVESSNVNVSAYATTPSTVGSIDVYYDYEFLIPQTVKGKLYVVATYTAYAPTGAGAATTLTLKPIHYDGTTATDLATAQAADWNQVAVGVTTARHMVDTVVFTVDRFFKVGEKLRLHANIYVSSNNGYGYLYHDGANRNLSLTDTKTGTSADSNLKIIVPFKVDA